MTIGLAFGIDRRGLSTRFHAVGRKDLSVSAPLSLERLVLHVPPCCCRFLMHTTPRQRHIPLGLLGAVVPLMRGAGADFLSRFVWRHFLREANSLQRKIFVDQPAAFA